MKADIRLAPSGPVVASFGQGALLRSVDTTSLMTGSTAIPTVAAPICPDGFANTDAIVLTLDNPRADLLYGAEIELDVVNTSTTTAAEVVLYLDISIDGGATYTNYQKNVHHMTSNGISTLSAPIGSNGRSVSCHIKQLPGAAFGVAGAPSIKLRARASAPLATGSALTVDSVAASNGSEPITGCNGTIYMALREYLG